MHWETKRHTGTDYFTLHSACPKQICAKYLARHYFFFIALYSFYLTQVPRTLQRKTLCLKNKDVLSDSRFGVAELSLTSRGRAGTQ